jgi:hypothetical protein
MGGIHMSILEQEILDRYRQMSPERRKNIRALLDGLDKKSGEPGFNYDQWKHRADQLLADMRAEYGADYYVGSQDLLDELREEASWPRS